MTDKSKIKCDVDSLLYKLMHAEMTVSHEYCRRIMKDVISKISDELTTLKLSLSRVTCDRDNGEYFYIIRFNSGTVSNKTFEQCRAVTQLFNQIMDDSWPDFEVWVDNSSFSPVKKEDWCLKSGEEVNLSIKDDVLWHSETETEVEFRVDSSGLSNNIGKAQAAKPVKLRTKKKWYVKLFEYFISNG